MTALTRRSLLRSGAVAATGLSLGSDFWRRQLAVAATPAKPGRGPYGSLGPENADGLRLPAGFRSRRIATANQPIGSTGFVQPLFPDGQALFDLPDGGWILVTNSEVPDFVQPQGGGASAIRFDKAGAIKDAYRILGGTQTNCSGGPTPWGTWMSCEETDTGRVWECDPAGKKPAVVHPAMGVFSHEALCVDADAKKLYLSEDDGSGGFYRFTPTNYPDCSKGLLEVAIVGDGGAVRWVEVPDPLAKTKETRQQVPGMTKFRRGEGIRIDSGIVYLATTSDNTVWAYNTGTETIEKLFDGAATKDPPFKQCDNIAINNAGELFLCEDPGTVGMGVITPEGEVARFMEVTGAGQVVPGNPAEDIQSELTGPVFDSTGTRMYVCAQRSFFFGVIYEITGPFRTVRPPDKGAPPLLVDVPATMPIREYARNGVPVSIRLGEAATVTASVRTAFTPRGKRGKRAANVGRDSFSSPRFGATKVQPKPKAAMARELRARRRGLRAFVTVVATDAAGNKTTVERKLILGRPRK